MFHKSYWWLFIISATIGIFTSFILILAIWLICRNNGLEFELYLKNIILFWVSTTIIIYLLLYYLVYDNLQKILKQLEENSFYQSNTVNYKSINPFNNIIKNLNLYNKKIEEEKFKLNKLENYRREYIGNVSHELKTPVFNIEGYISALLETENIDEKISKSFLEKAEKNVNRMINIIDDLQTISLLETGELKLETDAFEINKLINEVIEDENETIAKSKLFVDFKKSDDLIVFADRNRIKQVLSNLLINSAKYCNTEGGRTVIRIYELENSINIEISDNGIGIEHKHLKRIFERFYRVDNSRSRDKGGSGLGLAIVKHIIEAHHQKIDVMSTPGAGTIFSFSLQKFKNDEN
ncbi:MAG: sensor histidine kinase [Bacteroidia bacterium]|nr:sensor histidine kinase [Bacteroidia bacterium]